MCIILIASYYMHYFIWDELLRLFFSEPIMCIMRIIAPLFELFFCLTIITIIFFQFYYTNYFFPNTLSALFQLWLYGDQNNRYNAYNRHNCIKFIYTPPRILKWYMASESGFNSWNAFPYIRGSYSSKNIAKSRWSVHLRLGRHPKETGV